ncbi:MAG: peptidase dimerization domain protein, partial [Bacteroidetes bacterium]
MTTTTQYLQTHQQRFLEELLALLRIPSVSARSEHKADMIDCANVVKQRL